MILLGCLLAFTIAIAPRVVLVLAWLFSDRWDVVWQGDWVVPLLGILFMPFTTVMYLLAWTLTGGIEGWDWMWIILGVIMDVGKWGQVLANRRQAAAQIQNYYLSGAPVAAPVAAAPVAAEPVATEPAEPVSPTGDGAPDLARSNELRASGVLADEEYDAAKAKLDG